MQIVLISVGEEQKGAENPFLYANGAVCSASIEGSGGQHCVII